MPSVVEKIATKPISPRKEVMLLVSKLQDEIQDMQDAVKEDLNNRELKDEDIFRIKENIKELEKQILRIIEG